MNYGTEYLDGNQGGRINNKWGYNLQARGEYDLNSDTEMVIKEEESATDGDTVIKQEKDATNNGIEM